MKKYLFIATAFVALASCSSDDFVGEYNPADESANGAITFGFDLQNITRGEIAGDAAAKLLDNNFYVTGTKGTEGENNPTETLVFDNYLVHYGVNTAGTTTSNTANWEYVSITPGTGDYANYDKLSALNSQTIKFWDYGAAQYDFLAFSTGSFKAKKDKETPADDEIGVTAMKYGTNLANSGVAYTFHLPSITALSNTYISDITKVTNSNYGKEVMLKFKNLGSKVRVALYETVPGYSVKDVVFYKVDGTTSFTDGDEDNTNDKAFKSSTVALISANSSGIPTSGKIEVYFPHIGTNKSTKEDYNKAAATVTVGSTSENSPTFGELTAQLKAKESNEAVSDNVYLGRSLPDASFAGSVAANYYQTVFPVSTPAPLTLRVDYTLVPIDGAAETITVYGAKAVVPSTYTKWLPNYAYTYIFKISDNTNGWTTSTGATTDNQGLFPITFDAVVAEVTDATAEQTTITTVATPTITTYQQGHDITKDEYSKATGKNVYVQVMDNSAVPATLKGDLNGTTTDGTKKSLLYAVTGTTSASEALVMDALENQSSVASGVITGRNGVILNPATIDATVTSIENGVDDNPIGVTAGQAAKITITGDGALAAGTYAYVYDYSTAAKVTTTIYQPIAVEVGTTDIEGMMYVTNSTLVTWDAGATSEPTHYTSSSEKAEAEYLYFSITTNGGATKTYSFISVDGKLGTALPDGLLKVPTTQLNIGATNAKAAADTFYFNIYTRNDGKYAVKVIKIVD